MTYGLVPSQTESCPETKQMYINGYFCYAVILTNELGIDRHIVFLDNIDFKSAHPEISVDKKSDSQDEDKSIGYTSTLIPLLSDFFSLYLNLHHDILLEDSRV